MDETIFFDYDGVKVTNTRVVIDEQTFAMNNVTSVRTLAEPPKLLGWIALLIFALLLALSAPEIGILLVGVVGFVIYKKNHKKYHIVLSAAGGEAKVLSSYQKNYVDKVVAAINSAIIHRG